MNDLLESRNLSERLYFPVRLGRLLELKSKIVAHTIVIQLQLSYNYISTLDVHSATCLSKLVCLLYSNTVDAS